MANIRIADTPQRIQYVATASQTVFAVPFPFLVNTDIVAYQNSTKLAQGGAPGQYGLSGAGTASGGTLTLVTGASVNDIITIYGATPVDRTSIYSPTVSNLTGDDLNNDFNRDILMIKQQQTTQDFLQLQYAPYASVSQDATVTVDRWLPILPAGGIWRKNDGNTAIEAAVVPAFPVGSFGGNFTQSYRLVRTNISTGANEIEQMDVALTTSPLTMQSTAASWYIGSAVDLNLTATQNLNLKGQRWPNAIGSEGQVIGVQGGILAYLSVPSAEVPTTVDQIPMFFDSFGGIKDSPFARSGTDLLLAADPTVPLAAATKQYVDAATAGAALTEVSDTNITLTLGGSPATALLRAASITVAWAGLLAGTRGGTGVNNGASTITVGGNFAMSGAHTFTGTLTADTAVTFPVSGTLATTAGANIPAIAQGDLLYGSATNVLSALAKSASASRYLSNTGASNNPAWAQVDLTNGVTGILPAANGGSGVASPTIHGILVAQGSSAFTPIVLGAGQVLIGTTSSDPVAGAIGSGSGILVGNSSGAITISNTGVLSNVATANQTTVSGATGNVTIGLASNAILPGSGGVQIPSGNTAARAGAAGTIRFNTQSGVFESTADGATWATIETSATGVVSVSGTTNRISVSPNTGLVVVDIDAAYVGQSSITTVGTIGTGTWAGTNIALNHGGSGAALTASNGGIVYSTASAMAILSGTATAQQLLMSGASTTPQWSTTTYPTTNAINTLLYASSANVMSALATANSSVLVTSSGGVPSLSTTLPSGLAATNLTLTTPALGTPSAGVLTNCTGLPVAGGGTGNSTFTAYSVICAGTTATGAFQNVSGLGSSGNVLTSNGASALPTWQAASGGSGGAKVWANWTTGGTTIAKSFNVSSITNIGTGQSTVNFTSNLSDANYATTGGLIQPAGNTSRCQCSVAFGTTPAVGSVNINTTGDSGALANVVAYIACFD